MIRRLKIAYAFYNLFHKARLKHNVAFYKKLNLNKLYFSPISSRDFAGLDGQILKQGIRIKAIAETDLFKKLPEPDQQSLLDFDSKGFAILRGYVSQSEIDQINHEIDDRLAAKDLTFVNRNKIMFAYRKIDALRTIATNHQLIEILSSLLADHAKLFQSINFLTGSEQDTHSDSIHMTTFPLGGLLGVWIALEDIDLENGPLHYYIGSHKLPYYLNRDYDNEGNAWLIGDKTYTEYEKMIASKIKEHGLEKSVFTAKAGDLLIWHANLFHGGQEHINKDKTRKSVVLHYYAENSICYHEITQRPTLFE